MILFYILENERILIECRNVLCLFTFSPTSLSHHVLFLLIIQNTLNLCHLYNRIFGQSALMKRGIKKMQLYSHTLLLTKLII